MNARRKLIVRRRTAAPAARTPEELAELRAVRERFQRERPTLEEVLAASGQHEATTLGGYLHTAELLLALRQERERQQITLARLADRTGYDPAVLSRLLSGQQPNPTLSTVHRIAAALGKEVVHTLRDLPGPQQTSGSAKKQKAPGAKFNGRSAKRASETPGS